MTKHRMVVVGGGFAGLTLARTLAKESRCEVTLIDKNEHQVYTPWLYEIVAGGMNKSSDYIKKLTTGARIPLRSICKRLQIRFRQGEVSELRKDAKEIRFTDGLTLSYDTLIIACGVRADDFGIPGVRENVIMIKSLEDAVRAQEAVRAVVHEAVSGKPQTIVVCGAGPNGVECASEIAHSARALGVKELRVVIVEGSDRPLKSAHEKLSERALRRLYSLKVDVMCGTRLISCEPGLATVQKDGQKLHVAFDACFFTAGTRPFDVMHTLGLPLSPRGRLLTDGTFRVQGEAHIYAIGDCAAMTTNEESPLPQTAQAAHEQASFLGFQLMRMLRGATPRIYQPPKRWYLAVAVGGKFAVADLKIMYVAGYLGFLLRRIADVRYYYAILPWQEATWRLARSLWLYNKNDHA